MRPGFGLGLLLIGMPIGSALGAPTDCVALVTGTGRVELRADGAACGTLTAGFAESSWRFHDLEQGGAGQPILENGRRVGLTGRIPLEGGVTVATSTRLEKTPGGFLVRYEMEPSADLAVNSVHATFALPTTGWAGARWEAGASSGTIPRDTGGPTQVYTGAGEALRLVRPDGLALRITPRTDARVLLQDSRQWGPALDVRIGAEAGTWRAGERFAVELEVQFGEEVRLVFDEPVVLEASDEWIPYTASMDIAPGSALDWSGQGLVDAPAGRHGPIVVGQDGHFEFARRPGVPVRIWGVNLCFSALYLDHAQSDRLATRLRMLGYNAARIHHYESGLIDGSQPNSITLAPDALDRLEYLIAALKREGLYVTTEGFVSRPVRCAEVFPGREGTIAMDTFKMLALIDDRAFACWCDFVRAFLTHVNPYTGMALKDDPALASFVLINEGNAGNFVEGLDSLAKPVWMEHYNAWLAARYGDRQGLAEAWATELGDGEDPARATVELRRGAGRRAADLGVFWASVQRESYARMSGFVKEELGLQAPLTDMNGWTETLANQSVRADFDYVDTHYYWDHPNFLERPWSLPSRGWSNGECMTSAGGAGARDRALLRLFGKPFTVSEFNSPPPNRYRAECGLLMGAVASLQDWDGAYRFAYSHSAGNISEPAAMNYFDLASDPLTLASDRAALLLFLRRDLQPAAHRVAVRLDPAEALGEPAALPSPEFPIRELAYVTGLGTRVGAGDEDLAFAANGAAEAKGLTGSPGSSAALAEAIGALRERGWLAPDNPTDPEVGILASETGEIVLDAKRGTLAIESPRFAAVFAARPGTTVTAGPLAVTLEGSGGAVWVASLDGEPLATSGRLLVVHLTDMQNTGERFRDSERKTLEAWGGLPYLARWGTAAITLARAPGAEQGLSCWALGGDGTREGRVDLTQQGGGLALSADVRGPDGARLYYEVARD